MVASVPELTKRTISMLGIASTIRSASCTSIAVVAPNAVPRPSWLLSAHTTAGWACPRMCGPYARMKSEYSVPSSSTTRAPRPRAMIGGSPPTAAKARTGLLTPPGSTRRARSRHPDEESCAGPVTAAG